MYNRLMEKLEQTTAIKWFSGRGVEKNWIKEAEEELGFTLPPSYCWWLRNYGNAFLDGSYILTLTSPEFRDILVMIFSIFIVPMWLMRLV